MREIVEAKQKQAEEQLAAWQRKLAEAQEQCVRWHAILGACQELLAEDVPVVTEQNDSHTAD